MHDPTTDADPIDLPEDGGRVLVVDDRDGPAAALSAVLDAVGLTPLSVPARAAVGATVMFNPAVVVVVGAAGLDAERVTVRVLALPADLRPRVVAVVGFHDPGTRSRLQALGVDCCEDNPTAIVAWIRRSVREDADHGVRAGLATPAAVG